jgi:hypothetical protein
MGPRVEGEVKTRTHLRWVIGMLSLIDLAKRLSVQNAFILGNVG